MRNTVNGTTALGSSVFTGDGAFYPLVVLAEALAKSQSVAPVFLLDEMLALIGSLWRRESHLIYGRWRSKSRYWIAATANRGHIVGCHARLRAHACAQLSHARCPLRPLHNDPCLPGPAVCAPQRHRRRQVARREAPA